MGAQAPFSVLLGTFLTREKYPQVWGRVAPTNLPLTRKKINSPDGVWGIKGLLVLVVSINCGLAGGAGTVTAGTAAAAAIQVKLQLFPAIGTHYPALR